MLATPESTPTQLGRGRQGTVYLACDRDRLLDAHGCEYVMKVSDLYDEQDVNLWKQEVSVLQRLKGSGLAPDILEAWSCKTPIEEGEMVPAQVGVIVMEKFTGTLDQLLAKGNLEEKQRLHHAVIQLLDRLVWEYGVIHGDVKAENFLWKVTPEGKLRVVAGDYGLSRTVPSHEQVKSTEKVFGQLGYSVTSVPP